MVSFRTGCRQFRQQQPDAELQLNPLSSLEQVEAIRAGRLDAGFVFNMPKADRELDQLQVDWHNLVLAAPKGHPLTKIKKLRLRDMVDADFVWFPRRQSPAYYDRLMHECFRGGLKSPRMVQEAADQATLLSLVTCRLWCGVRQRTYALAMSRRRGVVAGNRFESAAAFFSCLAER